MNFESGNLNFRKKRIMKAKTAAFILAALALSLGLSGCVSIG